MRNCITPPCSTRSYSPLFESCLQAVRAQLQNSSCSIERAEARSQSCAIQSLPHNAHCAAASMKRLLLIMQSIAALQGPLRVRTRRPATDDAAEVVVDDETPERELPIDFGSSGTQWTFEWPAVDDEPWSVRDVAGGGAMFAACHIASGALGAPIAVRLAGTGAFLATQATLPLPKGVSPSDVSDAFDASQTIPVSKIGDTPWWGVALGASVPTIQIVLVCVKIKILRRVRAESSRRPPRHRHDVCSMAWQ